MDASIGRYAKSISCYFFNGPDLWDVSMGIVIRIREESKCHRVNYPRQESSNLIPALVRSLLATLLIR